MTVTIDRDRFVATMEEQAAIGATEGGGLHRLALSDADREIRDWFREQLEALDLAVRIDEFGNMFGRREGTDPNAEPVLVGSHLDSQPYGGIYRRSRLSASGLDPEAVHHAFDTSIPRISDSPQRTGDSRTFFILKQAQYPFLKERAEHASSEGRRAGRSPHAND